MKAAFCFLFLSLGMAMGDSAIIVEDKARKDSLEAVARIHARDSIRNAIRKAKESATHPNRPARINASPKSRKRGSQVVPGASLDPAPVGQPAHQGMKKDPLPCPLCGSHSAKKPVDSGASASQPEPSIRKRP